MGLMNEYLDKHLTVDGLRSELQELIKQYNKATGHFLLVYAPDFSKADYPISLEMQDYFIIDDILPQKPKCDYLDFYIETPGGSGEAAEAIADLLHDRYKEVNFIIAGEAKSAGTILALSGNNIIMTETGSLGPIDAQCRIGRGWVSADDYMTWVKEKMAAKELTPFEAMMVAQISPGELYGIQNSLEYAKDLVLKWLPKYKFKNWIKTETRKINVTKEMRQERAREIANALTDHKKWRSHGRSLNRNELNKIKLNIDRIQDEKVLDVVKRIQIVLRLLFSSSSIYKVFSTNENRIMKLATPANPIIERPPIVPFEVICPKCGKQYKMYIEWENDNQAKDEMESQGYVKMPDDAKINCDCGNQIDLTPVKNEIEAKTGRKVL